MSFPVCTSCGKSTRTHLRPKYCAACQTGLDNFDDAFGAMSPRKSSRTRAFTPSTNPEADLSIAMTKLYRLHLRALAIAEQTLNYRERHEMLAQAHALMELYQRVGNLDI